MVAVVTMTGSCCPITTAHCNALPWLQIWYRSGATAMFPCGLSCHFSISESVDNASNDEILPTTEQEP